MVLDDALAEDPELVGAATSATVLAVANGNLEGELRASRTQLREEGAAERKRIEANLHDSAQQRLVALSINLERTGDRLDGTDRLTLRQYGAELERALEDMRSATSGGQPRDLSALGAAFALRSLARSAAVPVFAEDHGFGRRSELIESTVFFCCAEALQNATKHAGPDASVVVRLAGGDGWVRFSVEDDGAGFDVPTVRRGLGLDNMRDRVVAAGGRLAIESAPSRGTRVRGHLPDDA
jgi:signal transduction histidine kinase